MALKKNLELAERLTYKPEYKREGERRERKRSSTRRFIPHSAAKAAVGLEQKQRNYILASQILSHHLLPSRHISRKLIRGQQLRPQPALRCGMLVLEEAA